MPKDRFDVSDKTRLNIPIANFVVIVSLIVSSVYGFSQLENRISSLETQDTIMKSDLLGKAEQTPKNLEIYMLIESNSLQIEKHQELLEENLHTQVTLEHLEKQLDKAIKDIEYLKNLTRSLNGGN